MRTPARSVYTQCDIRLRSEVELHLPPAPENEWDVDIRWGEDIADTTEPPPGELIATYGPDATPFYTATTTGSHYLIRFRDCGEFVISADLSDVQVRRYPSGRPELLPILLAGTVSAFLLTLRGETVLHASAVALDGSALAFVGQSGRGKSTLAALLCTHGAALVADDLLTIDADSSVTCVGGSLEIRLRSAATEMVRDRSEAGRVTADERLAFAAAPAPLGPIPLTAIVVPAPSHTATELRIHRLRPPTALLALLSLPRVHGWRREDVLSRDFATLGQVVNSIPVFGVEIPWGPPFSGEIARRLSDLGRR